MTIIQMESCKDKRVPTQSYCYTIPQLIEIGCKTSFPVGMDRFSTEAIQAGIVTGPSLIAKPTAMPLGDVSVNRDRGWSIDSRDSTEDHVVFLGSGSNRPRRQPRNAPSEARAQSDDGFARFLKQHSSPTHQRVTAGGRIVPMEPTPAPPQFNLLIENLTRGKNCPSQQQRVVKPEIGNKYPVPVMNGAVTVNANLPSTDLPSDQHRNGQQTINSAQHQNASASQNAQVNTRAGGLKSGNHMPRLSDLPYLTTATTSGLPQPLGSFASSFNLNPQSFSQSQCGPLAFPLSGMIPNPYMSMLFPSGEQQPIMPSPIIGNQSFSSVSGADQMGFHVARADEYDLSGLQSLPPGLWTNYNTGLPLNPSNNGQFAFPSSTLIHSGMASSGQQQGNLTAQIGTYGMTGYGPPGPATDTQFNSMAVDHSSAQTESAALGKVTHDDVARAEYEFHQLDVKLQGHDQYTASHHSTFTPQTKSYYGRERMKLVGERHMARVKWTQLRAALDQENSAQRNLPNPPPYQQTSSTKPIATASTPMSGNKNLNVQAAAWVPKETDNGNMVPQQPPLANQHVSNPSSTDVSATGLFKAGSDNFLNRTKRNVQTANPLVANQNAQSSIPLSVDTTPGPYARQLFHGTDGEISQQEVDEWGVRRGFAPPQLAQKQSEEAMRILSQLRGQGVGHIGSAPSGLQASVGNSPTTISPYLVDEWGARIGHAPPELAQLQDEQWAKLARMHPEQRSRVSLATLDSLPSNKGNSSKTVSFVDNNANTTYRIPFDSNDDTSSVGSSDENGWRPMKSGEAPPPTKGHWHAVIEASNKEAGVKTEVPLAKGISITVEGKGSRLAPITTGTGAEGSDRGRKHHSVMSEQDRLAITKQLMSIEKGARGLECATKKPANPGLNPWIVTDENNFFRHKGRSSVAVQSVTAPGKMPGSDGAIDQNGQKAVEPLPDSEVKVGCSPFKVGSPRKRSLKDIWGGPSRRAQVGGAKEEDEMGDVHSVMYKF